MADDNKFNQDDKQKKGGDFRMMPPRTMLLWMSIIFGVLALMYLKQKTDFQADPIKQAEFMDLLESNRISEATIAIGAVAFGPAPPAGGAPAPLASARS